MDKTLRQVNGKYCRFVKIFQPAPFETVSPRNHFPFFFFFFLGAFQSFPRSTDSSIVFFASDKITRRESFYRWLSVILIDQIMDSLPVVTPRSRRVYRRILLLLLAIVAFCLPDPT